VSKPLRVLVIESQKQAAGQVCAGLKWSGWAGECVEFQSLADAVMGLQSQPFDVIFCEEAQAGERAGGLVDVLRELKFDGPVILIEDDQGQDMPAHDFPVLRCRRNDLGRLFNGGNIAGSLQVFHAQLEIEAALREREQNFREIFNSTNEAIMVHDAQTGQILDVNQSALNIYGYLTKEAICRVTIGDLSAANSSFNTERARELVLKASQEGPQVFEWQAKRADGATFWAEVSLSRLRWNGQNRVMAVVRNIDERKRMEERLHNSELHWQFAIEGAGDGLWDWDIQAGEIIYSRQWKALLGYAEEEVGSSLDDWKAILHPEDRQRWANAIQDHLGGRTAVYQDEHRLVCKDGHFIWGLSRGKVVSWTENGKPERMIGTLSDITERKLAENKINDQLEELRRWHKVTLGREERILQLKGEVNRLLIESGKPPRYGGSSVDTI